MRASVARLHKSFAGNRASDRQLPATSWVGCNRGATGKRETLSSRCIKAPQTSSEVATAWHALLQRAKMESERRSKYSVIL
eukprot:CAMPEP_0182808584 /NCGR_PEP_ID=MMETSP0006_2-20121128/6727_1 /TAXON_ID=97485 /ORGANISM="Prymnesium parvum, Strain Texoma1" /LENGTH=80 /DNA_ID=CAMNT_0024934309 /DNA_START=980 /DNA_END=1222 /DNA_ORIENTATION=+